MAAMSLGSAAKPAVYEACRFLGINSFAHKKHRRQVLVLCYHGVVSQAQRDRFRYANTVSVDEFDAHMATLSRDFSPISGDELIAWYHGGALPDYPVLVTFDDGYRNNLTHAAGVLRKHRVPCVFHVTTSYIGTERTLWTDEMVSRILEWPEGSLPLPQGGVAALPAGAARRALAAECRETCKRIPWEEARRYHEQLWGGAAPLNDDAELYRFLNWDEVRQLREQGFEIGSHTVDHPILSQLSPEELRRQLTESKSQIERETGAPCRFLAYPNGSTRDFSPAVEQAAREAGYQIALTIVEDFNAAPEDAMAVKRLCIMGHLPVSSFLYRVNGTQRVAR